MSQTVFALALAVCLSVCLVASGDESAHLTVHGEVVARIDPLIFGQMFECAWAGREVGAEAAWDAKRGGWQEGFVDLVRELGPTNIRWPGGWWADHYDWRKSIDNVPGREGPRPCRSIMGAWQGKSIVLPAA